ncbi:MAG: hypothetical protein ACC645_17085, partial [Pirellulales bacterium]
QSLIDQLSEISAAGAFDQLDSGDAGEGANKLTFAELIEDLGGSGTLTDALDLNFTGGVQAIVPIDGNGDGFNTSGYTDPSLLS